jgi:hypothetical protein
MRSWTSRPPPPDGGALPRLAEQGFDNRDFFWSDMLHYRWTSPVRAPALGGGVRDEREDDVALWSERLKAHALGY